MNHEKATKLAAKIHQIEYLKDKLIASAPNAVKNSLKSGDIIRDDKGRFRRVEQVYDHALLVTPLFGAGDQEVWPPDRNYKLFASALAETIIWLEQELMQFYIEWDYPIKPFQLNHKAARRAEIENSLRNRLFLNGTGLRGERVSVKLIRKVRGETYRAEIRVGNKTVIVQTDLKRLASFMDAIIE